jgi:hypothetical protein
MLADIWNVRAEFSKFLIKARALNFVSIEKLNGWFESSPVVSG